MNDEDGESKPRYSKAAVLKKIIDRAKEVKKARFGKIGEEITKYAYGSPDSENKFDYQAWNTTQHSFDAKVAKTHQAVRIFGPYLYQNNPKRRVMVRENAQPVWIARAEIIQTALNYFLKEYEAKSEFRSAIDDAITWGEGVVWHGLHREKPWVVVSIHDSVENFLVDGDATTWTDVNWVARKRTMPRWKLKKLYPAKGKEIDQLPPSNRCDSASYDNDGKTSVDLVEYYEVYMKVGLHNYSDDGDGEDVEDAPVKYCFAPSGDGGVVLHEGEWEIPYHLDGDWPCTPLLFIQNPKSIWPISPLESGLGWQRALNWCATAIVAKHKWSSRQVIAFLTANGVGLNEEQKAQIESGSDPVSVIEMALTNTSEDADIRKYVQQIKLADKLDDDFNMLSYLGSEYEKATGLHEFLFSGEGSRQARSSAEAQIRDRNSRGRVDDMMACVESWATKVARKEAMAARFLLDDMDVRRVVGAEPARAWGTILTPEQMDPMFWTAKYMQEGHPPDVAMAMAQDILADALTMEDWAAEIEYDIEAGDTRRQSPEQELELLQESMNQTVPTLMQLPNPMIQANALDIVTMYMRKAGAGVEMIDRLKDSAQQLRQMGMMPPPPPPEPGMSVQRDEAGNITGLI